MQNIKRCSWCNNDELYIKYHDKEWGVAVHDDCILFEFLILEGAQAGLSWITILKKRNNYREVFDNFDFKKIMLYNNHKIDKLMRDKGIIRNRLKILSVINNARVFDKIVNEFGNFNNYIWNFVNHKIIYEDGDLVRSSLSDEISKDLVERGMKFVGTRIIYAFLQAIGIICAHEPECFKYKNNFYKY